MFLGDVALKQEGGKADTDMKIQENQPGSGGAHL